MIGFRKMPRIVRLEALGGGALLVLMALNEYLDLPKLLFGEAPTPLRHEEFLLETAGVVVISLVAIVVSWLSARRRTELNRLLLMCSWCRQVHIDDRWLPLEAYLHEKEAITATRGLCPACYAKHEPRKAGEIGPV